MSPHLSPSRRSPFFFSPFLTFLHPPGMMKEEKGGKVNRCFASNHGGAPLPPRLPRRRPRCSAVNPKSLAAREGTKERLVGHAIDLTAAKSCAPVCSALLKLTAREALPSPGVQRSRSWLACLCANRGGNVLLLPPPVRMCEQSERGKSCLGVAATIDGSAEIGNLCRRKSASFVPSRFLPDSYWTPTNNKP